VETNRGISNLQEGIIIFGQIKHALKRKMKPYTEDNVA